LDARGNKCSGDFRQVRPARSIIPYSRVYAINDLGMPLSGSLVLQGFLSKSRASLACLHLLSFLNLSRSSPACKTWSTSSSPGCMPRKLLPTFLLRNRCPAPSPLTSEALCHASPLLASTAILRRQHVAQPSSQGAGVRVPPLTGVPGG
jgi:hypothetical protein